MSKRLLFKNKIIRFYEEDIWGIFFKKQQRRDIFFKKYIYIFFLTRFIKELKKRWRLRKSFRLLIARSLYINLCLKKKRYKFFLKKKKWKKNKRHYFYNKHIKYNNSKKFNKKTIVVSKKKIFFSYVPRNFKYNKKQIKNILHLNKHKRINNQFLFLLNHYKQYSIFKNKIIYLLKLKNIFYLKTVTNKKKNKNKFLFFIRLHFNKYRFNLTYDFINFYFLYLKYKLNKILYLLKKEVLSIANYKVNLLYNFKSKYSQQIQLNTFNWNVIYLKYFKLTLIGKQLYLNFLLTQNNFNLINYYYFNSIQKIYINKNLLNSFYYKIIFVNYFKNFYFITYMKKIIYIFNILTRNNKFLQDKNFNIQVYSELKNNNINITINNISKFVYKLYIYIFSLFTKFIINNNKYYYLSSKNIINIFNTYNKWTLRKFLSIRIRPFLKKKKQKQGALIFCLITLLNFTKWLKRRIKRFMYKIRNYYYYKYNNFEDNDSVFAGNKFDITKIDTSFIKTEKDRKNNFILLTALENLKNNKNKPRKYITLSTIITKPSISFSKTEYLLSFYASTKLYKFLKKLKVNYIKTMLLKRHNIVNKLPYKRIINNSSAGNSLILYSKYLNGRIDNVSKRERFYSIKKRKTALQKMFTLNLVPIVKYVKKKKAFNSFYTYKMAKVWKLRKFYGCLTNYEFKSICTKALKFHGDVLIRFIILLESRIDTLLFRSGFVSSIFEARQIINHSAILINNRVIDKRSYTLKSNEMLSISLDKLNYLIDSCLLRINNQNILFRPPIYLEVNYKYYLVTFLYDIVNVNNIPYNFNITGSDLNTILYYYY